MEVKLIKHDDYFVCKEAAGVCRKTANKQSALIHSIKAGHLSILEHCYLTFDIKGISRACSHQLVRHRIASYAQQSQRHTIIEGDDWYITPPNVENFDTIMKICKNNYDALLSAGVKAEDARYVLPNACKTELIMTINLRSLINFFEHRMCTRAQWEIRNLAQNMYNLTIEKYYFIKDYFMFPNCKNCKEPCHAN